MDKYPISASSLEKYYYIDGHQLERQYKEHLSDYLNWKDKEQGEHADKWLVFPQNVAPRMSIDETSLSDEELYPDIENAYNLTDELRRIYSSTNIKGVAYTKLAHWYKHVEDAGYDSFQVVKQTIYENYIDILNFFDNRSTNASAESFNAKIKNFRAQLRGISDVKYFLFRLQKIYA